MTPHYNSEIGNSTFSRMTFTIMTLSMKTIILTPFIIMTLCISTFRIVSLSIMTYYDTQHWTVWLKSFSIISLTTLNIMAFGLMGSIVTLSITAFGIMTRSIMCLLYDSAQKNDTCGLKCDSHPRPLNINDIYNRVHLCWVSLRKVLLC